MFGQNLCNALQDSTILVVAQGLEPAAEIVFLHQQPGLRLANELALRQLWVVKLLCWYLHLVVVEELEYPSNPESYAVGSLATGRATLGGQVEG